MLIWLALLIPVVTAVVLYHKFKHQTLWWEFLIPFLVSAFLIGVSKYCIETLQTRDTEYWGGWAVKAEYYEDWNELVTYTETYTDSKGRTQTRTKTRIDYHPPYWQVVDNNGCEISVNSATFESLCQKFGNKRFIELNRNYHTDDGDLYVTVWNQQDSALIPVTTSHSYENKVAVSDSVFNFPEVDPKTYGLFEYPEITGYYSCKSILGSGDPSHAEAERSLTFWNAKLGATKQVRMLILVFQNQPIQAGFEQESYWKGGNKNGFVITLGVDSQNSITWCHPFSWTEIEDLKVDTREFVLSQKTLNLKAIVDWLVPQVKHRFERKHFQDFAYISVEPPAWATFLVFVLVTALNLGLSYWIINNDHQEGAVGWGRYSWRGRL